MKELILSEREESTMASTWDEYLVLRLNDNGSYVLYTGRYEVLEEAGIYWNDESEEYDLPEKIAGKEVLWVKDGYVIGGDLNYYASEEAIEFTHGNSKSIVSWLEASGWVDDVGLDSVLNGVKELQKL